MKYDLATLARRARNPRRKSIVLREIVVPATYATNLYRAAYLPMLQVWQNSAPGIIAEYERTLSGMTTDSAEDLQARLEAASSELERLFILLDASLRDWSVSVERYTREKWRGAVLSATGVDLQTLIGPEDVRATLQTYLQWNAALVRRVSDEARDKIANAVFAGLQNRTPVREVAATISSATGYARDRSRKIAADQLSKISTSLAAERRREAGLSIYKFRHSGKKHFRPEHKARNNKLYAETKEDAGRSVEGETVNEPIERGRRAGQEPFCGCREQGVLVFDD